MKKKKSKFALVTGAGGGIGYEIARELLERGYDLILAGSNEERLRQATDKLARLRPGDQIILYAVQDLSLPDSAQALFDQVCSLLEPYKDQDKPLPVHILVNNAGAGSIGEASEIDWSKEEGELILNVVTLTGLTKFFLREMYRSGCGKILNLSSTGAFQPGPYTASYFASKAYVLDYTLAVRAEARKHGVQVCALCPGSTNTGFFHKAGSETPKLAMSPREVARTGVAGLMKNEGVIVPGGMNKLLRMVPKPIKSYFVGKIKKM